jgi:NADH-quinone oxidoreductase subunit M
VIAGLLFAVVGRMVYERTHTRKLKELTQRVLHRAMPFTATVFVIAALASMGMPGFSGFPAELSILIGAWKTSPIWAAFAALGILIAAAFTLRVVQVSFFGSEGSVPAANAGSSHEPPLAPITWAEKAGAVLLVGATLLIGLNPDLLLNWINPALQSPLFRFLFNGGSS